MFEFKNDDVVFGMLLMGEYIIDDLVGIIVIIVCNILGVM